MVIQSSHFDVPEVYGVLNRLASCNFNFVCQQNAALQDECGLNNSKNILNLLNKKKYHRIFATIITYFRAVIY